MATMAVTNESSVTLNAPQMGGYGVSPDAVGGNVSNPLPYPFNRNGSIAAGDTKTLGINTRDFTTRELMCQPELPIQEWDMLLQAGTISVVFADAGFIDLQDALIQSL